MTNNSDIKEAKRWTYAWLALTVLCLWVGDTQEPMKKPRRFHRFWCGLLCGTLCEGLRVACLGHLA